MSGQERVQHESEGGLLIGPFERPEPEALVIVCEDADEHKLMNAARRILRRHDGNATPFEEFFRALIMSAEHSKAPLTPRNLRPLWDQFDEDARWIRDVVRTWIINNGKEELEELMLEASDETDAVCL